MTLIIFVSLIMNNDGTNLCKVFHCALCLCIKSHNVMTSYESSGRMLELIGELIDELILLVTHLKYYDGPNCDLIKYKDLLVIIMGSDNNKIKIKIK